MTNQEKVKEFLLKHNKVLPNKPCIPDYKIIDLMLKLIQEEKAELDDALHAKDIIEVADALVDLEVVIHNASLYCGIVTQPLFDEVHRSNMTKDGGLRTDGKILKGFNYSPPRLEPLLKEQGMLDKLNIEIKIETKRDNKK